jgi:ParB-like nuclease domain
MFKPISSDNFENPKTEFRPGPAPQLLWIEIKDLVIDPSYQRDIGRRGAANIRQIAENFDWSKFAPVIVAPIEGGQYAVVDGQHRTTAALLRSLEKVPCQIVQADRKQQAAAFAAVNGSITKTTSQQLYYARLTARHPECVALQEVLAASGVQIVKTNLVLSRMKVGQTHAVATLLRCLSEYGPATLITSLQCITQTADGNAGFLRSSIIEGICEVLHKNRRWCEAGDALLRAMDELPFPDMWDEVISGNEQIFRTTASRSVAELVTAHLIKTLGSTSRPSTTGQHVAA